MYPNRYPGNCVECGSRVPVNAGFILKVDGQWLTWCAEHKPTPTPIIRLYVQDQPFKRVAFEIANLSREQFDAYYVAIKGSTYENNGTSRLSYVPVAKPAILAAIVKSLLDSPVLHQYVRTEPEVGEILAAYEEKARARIANVTERADTGLKLFPFQEVGAAWLAARDAALLADDMGLGKTIQVLAAHPDNAPLLVVGPAVAKGVWKREIKRWRKDIDTIQVLTGRGSFLWPDNGEAIITNYDILPAADHASLPLVPANCTLVIDEAHNAKNRNTARYQKLERLIKLVRGASGRVYMLTATPLLNRPQETWTLLNLAGLHTEAYGTWGRFCRAYNGSPSGGWGTPTPEAAEGLARVALRRTKAEVRKDIPAKMYEQRVVEVKLTMTENEEVRAAEEVLLREGPGVDFNRISKARAVLAKAKIPALTELVEEFENAGEPVVVFSCHRAPIDQLGERPGWALITGDTAPDKRTAIEDAFQKGELRGIGATVRAGGVAITLTKAANCIFVDRDWTPALNLQAEDRLCRIGQGRSVNVVQLIAEDSLDQRVEEIISDKTRIITNSIEKISNTVSSLDGMMGFGTADRLAAIPAATPEKETTVARVPPVNPAQARVFTEGCDVLSIDCPF